jgi:hypothetical protein
MNKPRNETSDDVTPQEWSLRIIRVENGYILEKSDGNKFVIEEDENDELREHEQLLLEIRDYFAFAGSKHDRERIQILRMHQNDV